MKEMQIEDKIIDFDSYMSQLKQYDSLVKEIGLSYNVYEMAQLFYQQLILKEYKLNDSLYDIPISDRYKTVVEQVKGSIDCKVEMLNEG